MNKFDLVRKIEKFAPLDTQEKWDCSGWLVCKRGTGVNKVMLALTVTDDIVAQAREQGCDMIISHHPLFFVPLEYSDIDIYCAHTNMDIADGGVTDTIIKTLGYTPEKTEENFVRKVTFNEPKGVSEFFAELKKISPNARYINNNDVKEIKSVGFCGGSGSDCIPFVEAEAFVTGDLKFHTALDSKIVVYDIGHFESEIMILPVFKEILGIDVVFAKEKSPFIY